MKKSTNKLGSESGDYADPLSSQVRTSLVRALPSLNVVAEGAEVRQRQVQRAGKWLVFRFMVRTEGSWLPITVTRGDATALRQVYERHYEALEFGQQAIFDEDERLLIEPFPLDWKLPALATVVRPDSVLAKLEESRALDEGGSPLRLELGRVRHVPHKRCLLEYRSFNRAGSARLYGKLYSASDRGERSFSALRAIDARKETQHRAPKPLLFDRPWRFLLMEAVPGTLLSTFIASRAEVSLDREISATALLLHLIHSTPVEGLPSRDQSAARQELERARRRLVHSALGTAIERTFEAVDRAEPVADPSSASGFIHGDFNPRQILIDGEIARAVDFDSAHIGDPAEDVGRFAASLRARFVENGEAPGLAEHFKAEYRKFSGLNLDDRASYFEGLSLLARVVRKHSAVPAPLLSPSASRIIEEASRLLAAGRSQG